MQSVLDRGFEAESFVAFPSFVYFSWNKNPQKKVSYQFCLGLLKTEFPLRLRICFRTDHRQSPTSSGRFVGCCALQPWFPQFLILGMWVINPLLFICVLAFLSCESPRAGGVCEVESRCGLTKTLTVDCMQKELSSGLEDPCMSEYFLFCI